MTTRFTWPLALCSVFALALAGCPEGGVGPEGPAGPAGDEGDDGQRGTDCWDLNGNGEADVNSEDANGDGSVDILDCTGVPGQDGEDGEDGENWAPASWVGSAECADCHDEQYQKFVRSGHPYKLVEIGGVEPTEPWDGMGDFGEFAPNPPDGWEWSDVSYVIGGWGWKQRFVDMDGYIITGSEVQWNLATEGWVAYHSDEDPGTKPYDCGSCHTSGYSPEGNQGGLTGVVGTWEQPGVHCEECHGRGSQHVADPYLVDMKIDRSAEQCGSCHYRTDPGVIPASGGYIKHHEQWNEMYHSKKHSMDCIDCHDPHASARYEDDTYNPNKSIRADCSECHFQEAAYQDSIVMGSFLDCIDCHMPYATKSAVAVDEWTGDVRTHLFAINTDATAPQFSEDGSEAMPYVSVDFACRRCHHDGGTAVDYDDATMTEEADGYHGG